MSKDKRKNHIELWKLVKYQDEIAHDIAYFLTSWEAEAYKSQKNYGEDVRLAKV